MGAATIRLAAGTAPLRRRLPAGFAQEFWTGVQSMKNDTGTFGLILGGIVALAAVVFIFSGGVLGGKTVVNGDQDLPPIAGDATPD